MTTTESKPGPKPGARAADRVKASRVTRLRAHLLIEQQGGASHVPVADVLAILSGRNV